MSFNPITNIEVSSGADRDIASWVKNYKESFVQHPHDTSQLTLVLPDDCLVVAGPTRLSHAGENVDGFGGGGNKDNQFYTIGFASAVSYSETSDVQPLKAIGSRRHIFAKTNSPVQIQIQRLMFLGMNLLRAIYAQVAVGSDTYARNSKYAQIPNDGFAGGDSGNQNDVSKAAWYSNIEEDIFRIPIGLGVIYNAPASLAGQKKYAGAEYFETCVFASRQVAMQAGQAYIMEDVSLYADRVVPWMGTSGTRLTLSDSDQTKQVQAVSNMA